MVRTDGGPNLSMAAAFIVAPFATGALGALSNKRRPFVLGRFPRGSTNVSSLFISLLSTGLISILRLSFILTEKEPKRGNPGLDFGPVELRALIGLTWREEFLGCAS